MIGSSLAYVSIAVRDVSAVAEMLNRDFHLEASMLTVGSSGARAPVFPIGKTPIALFEVGDPFVGGSERTGVHHIAVEVAGPVSAGVDAAEMGMPVLSNALEWGLGGTQRLLLDPQSTGGVVIYLSEPIQTGSRESSVVERIDHIGVASQNNDKARDIFTRGFGWPLESTQIDAEFAQYMETFTSDKYGLAHKSGRSELVGGVHAAFVTIGDCDLEFLQDLNPHQDAAVERGPGSTRQDQNVINRFIQNRGPGLHHLALKVRDIDDQLNRLESRGYSMIDTQGRPGSRLAQIGFVHPASLGGLLIHLVEREELP